jgi:hypothetical protein
MFLIWRQKQKGWFHMHTKVHILQYSEQLVQLFMIYGELFHSKMISVPLWNFELKLRLKKSFWQMPIKHIEQVHPTLSS